MVIIAYKMLNMIEYCLFPINQKSFYQAIHVKMISNIHEFGQKCLFSGVFPNNSKGITKFNLLLQAIKCSNGTNPLCKV